MSGFVGLFAAASVSCAMKSGSSTTPGGLMPSGAEAKNVYRSRYRSPVLASTTQEPLLLRRSRMSCKPSVSTCRASRPRTSSLAIVPPPPKRSPPGSRQEILLSAGYVAGLSLSNSTHARNIRRKCRRRPGNRPAGRAPYADRHRLPPASLSQRDLVTSHSANDVAGILLSLLPRYRSKVPAMLSKRADVRLLTVTSPARPDHRAA